MSGSIVLLIVYLDT